MKNIKHNKNVMSLKAKTFLISRNQLVYFTNYFFILVRNPWQYFMISET